MKKNILGLFILCLPTLVIADEDDCSSSGVGFEVRGCYDHKLVVFEKELLVINDRLARENKSLAARIKKSHVLWEKSKATACALIADLEDGDIFWHRVWELQCLVGETQKRISLLKFYVQSNNVGKR